MKVLAIDASTKSSGIAIFNGQTFLGKGCITASSSDLFKRIHKMVDKIDEVIAQAQIDEVVMEEVIPDHAKNTNTFKALMYLQAAILMMIHDNHPRVKVELIYPGSWRSQAGIKTGRGVKRETLKDADVARAKEIFGITQLNDDEADACLIGGVYTGVFGAPLKPEDNEINWGI